MAIELTPRHFTGCEQARSEITSEGLEFVDALVTPEELTPTPHAHAYRVDIYLLEGVLELFEPDTGRTHRLESGSKAVVPSNTLHSEHSPAGFRAMIGLPADRIRPDPANS